MQCPDTHSAEMVLRCYATDGTMTESMKEIGAKANEAEIGFAIVSGHRLFIAGGDMTAEGNFYPTPPDIVGEQIAQHGRAD